ncbi:MAG: hypothetical protein K9G44_09940, partial [Melioribacteraceae bacterium]|nr:hypothetical protein [Melioribacteraceae bacterium]
DAFVVDPDELSNINSVIDSYNSSIQTVASANGFGLVDVNGIFGSIASNGGVMLEGKLYTTAFVSGGLFSLDGVHPTNHGAVLIANAFIDVINSKYSANIAHVDITKIPGSIDLAKKNVIFDKFGIPRIPEGSLDNLLF